MGMLTIGVAAISLAAGQVDEQRIRLRAELRPCSLLPACYFSVTVTEGSLLTVVITDDREERREVARALSDKEVKALRERISEVEFFSLPPSVGCFMPEGTDRLMRVALGGREHTITLGVWPAACADVGFLSKAGKREADRALKLWRLVEGWAKLQMPDRCP